MCPSHRLRYTCASAGAFACCESSPILRCCFDGLCWGSSASNEWYARFWTMNIHRANTQATQHRYMGGSHCSSTVSDVSAVSHRSRIWPISCCCRQLRCSDSFYCSQRYRLSFSHWAAYRSYRTDVRSTHLVTFGQIGCQATTNLWIVQAEERDG